jgi:hypothetical protein
MKEMRGVYRGLVWNSEGKSSLRKLRGRWEDNIKMVLQDVGCEGKDWIDPTQVRAGGGHLFMR